MISLEEALHNVDAQLASRRVPTETVDVVNAAGRILASDATSRLDLPPFDKSAVDGYAIVDDDSCAEYRLVGSVAAGQTCKHALEPGTTVKVMTGAPVPKETGKVIMLERAAERDGFVRFDSIDGPANVVMAAEYVAAGKTILNSGSKIGSLEAANLIGCGVCEVRVARRVRVAIVSTGDELAGSLAELSPGKIINTNGPLLIGLAERNHLAVTFAATIADDKAALTAAAKQALAGADIVVLSGGVSAGEYDFVPDVITGCGLTIHFSNVAAKPGKPTVFATSDDKIIFGLPGNPVAVYVMFHLFVLRAAMLISGSSYEPLRFEVALARDFHRRAAGRTEFFPCRVHGGRLEPAAYHGSGDLAGLIGADGFMVIPQGVNDVPAGDAVSFVILDPGRVGKYGSP